MKRISFLFTVVLLFNFFHVYCTNNDNKKDNGGTCNRTTQELEKDEDEDIIRFSNNGVSEAIYRVDGDTENKMARTNASDATPSSVDIDFGSLANGPPIKFTDIDLSGVDSIENLRQDSDPNTVEKTTVATQANRKFTFNGYAPVCSCNIEQTAGYSVTLEDSMTGNDLVTFYRVMRVKNCNVGTEGNVRHVISALIVVRAD